MFVGLRMLFGNSVGGQKPGFLIKFIRKFILYHKFEYTAKDTAAKDTALPCPYKYDPT